MCDQSVLEKEATNFAFSTGNEKNLELVRLCWEACAAYLQSEISKVLPEAKGVGKLLSSITDKEINETIDLNFDS